MAKRDIVGHFYHFFTICVVLAFLQWRWLVLSADFVN